MDTILAPYIMMAPFCFGDQHFIALIQIQELHPRLHSTSATSGDVLFIQWPPTYFPLKPSCAWGGPSTPKPGPLRDRWDLNLDWWWRLQCCYKLRHSIPYDGYNTMAIQYNGYNTMATMFTMSWYNELQ